MNLTRLQETLPCIKGCHSKKKTRAAKSFGAVSGHYIRCLQDQMIELVDERMGNSTQKHTIDTSLAPLLSAVDGLTDILVSIAA